MRIETKVSNSINILSTNSFGTYLKCTYLVQHRDSISLTDQLIILSMFTSTAADQLIILSRFTSTAANQLIILSRFTSTSADQLIILSRFTSTAADQLIILSRFTSTAALGSDNEIESRCSYCDK